MPSQLPVMSWHEGERKIHRLLNVPPQDNPTSPFLESHRAAYLESVPLFAIGMLDRKGRPWTSLWGGDTTFVTSLGDNRLAVQVPVDLRYDPVVQIILSDDQKQHVRSSQSDVSRPMAALGIDLNHRTRVKIGGVVIAGKVNAHHDEGAGFSCQRSKLHVTMEVESSLGNCPKYLNRKHITSHSLKPELVSETLPLPPEAVRLVQQADSFYITSAAAGRSLSTNYRGGTPGFIRIMSNNHGSVAIAWPEYSGNRVYQTLGNLMVTPQAGLVFPDLKTGCVLYVTGTTEVVAAPESAKVIPKANLVVVFKVTAMRLVRSGLAVRACDGNRSPYNPPVFHLFSEKGIERAGSNHNPIATAALVECEPVAPTIIRFRFCVTSNASNAVSWLSGQYVILSFKHELDRGYSHMREEDPRSLNDDWTRSFTISSPAPPDQTTGKAYFELIIRNVGVATSHMFKASLSRHLQLPVLGFDGEFQMEHRNDTEIIAFVAGGVSITPFTSQISNLDASRIWGWWSVKAVDLNLVLDCMKRVPGMGKNMRVFITGTPCEQQCVELRSLGACVQKRRLAQADLVSESAVSRWYVCTGPKFSKEVLQWLEGKDVVVEDYTY